MNAKKGKTSLPRKLTDAERKIESLANAQEKTRSELVKSARKERAIATKSIPSARADKEKAKATKEQIAFDIKVHRLEKNETKEALHEIDELDCAVQDTKFIVEEADRVQKRKKK